ncbi:DUF5677 domain-containing protein [Brevundimonas sp.]|uniref:DUF5677 domain-containing protein n=1 Tax=Brevundimonas sp. TaxID=1871086 RepID=UPI001986FEC0|nr:DUF5677 domain-containing protein [Brevundimonas sp.]MBD3837742.1 hypothetical protein [Brevundimonas sp.]
MKDTLRKPVLADHVAVKRKLVPPFMKRLGSKLTQFSWTRQLVPEAVWIGLIIDHCGYEAARRHCLALSRAVRSAIDDPSRPMFVRLSAFLALSDTEKAITLSIIDAEAHAEIRRSLRPLAALAPTHPLAFLSDETAAAPEENRFPDILREFYDRNSRLAVLSLALAYELGLDQGKIHIASHLVEGLSDNFKVVGNYPETEESRRAAGSFRASSAMLFMELKLDGGGFQDDEPWVSEFWDLIAGFGPCLFRDTIEDEDEQNGDPLERFVIMYRNAVRRDLRDRLSNWPLDLNEIEAFEVVTALLCRQATLAIEMASSPATWTPHTGPIMLRAIADVFISLAWILKDPGPRAKKFVEDGQGAIKLQIAHQKRALETMTDDDEIDQMTQMIDVWSDWLASQRMEQFIEVNLGSWSGLNTRQMAEDAGFIDFYNYVYQPFSGVAHSNWAHVSMFNTLHCENPAHRLHRGAAIAPIPADLHWLYLASKYLSKTFGHFDDVFDLKGLRHDAFDHVATQLQAEARDPET